MSMICVLLWMYCVFMYTLDIVGRWIPPHKYLTLCAPFRLLLKLIQQLQQGQGPLP